MIDLHLVICKKPPAIRTHSKLPVSTGELIGLVECVYIIFSVLEFDIKFFLKIPHNSDSLPSPENEVIIRDSFTQNHEECYKVKGNMLEYRRSV